MNILKIIKEEIDDSFDWIRDVKTNDTIAKEIYDKLNWYKLPNVTTDYITNPWNGDIPFAVRKRTLGDSKLPIISPSTFSYRFRDYLGENYGIFYISDIKKIYNKLKELMGDKIHGTINESEDLNWIQDVKSDDSVRFDEDKLYYFNPPLTRHEVLDLMERIPNEIRYAHVKRWFDSLFLGEKPHNYMTYFSINSNDLEDSFYVGGWCDETHWTRARGEYYEDFEPINGRDKFFGHYRIMESSKDFDWVDEIPKYDFHNGYHYIDISGLDEDEACEVQQAILNMDIDWKDSIGLQKRFCDTYITKGYIIQNATLYRTPKSFDDYKEIIGNLDDMMYINGRTDLLA